MTTTAPRIKAGSAYGCTHAASGCNWPESGCAGNCSLRRVDASQLKDNRAVFVAGSVETNRSTLPHATEFAGPEPMLPYGTWRSMLVILMAVWSLYAAVPYFWRWLS